VSVEELSDIASRLGIAYIDPAWVAANIATEGAGPITQLPPGTLLRVSSGASIYIAASRYGEQVNQSANPRRRCSKKV
jgi:hypothetical protein